MQTKPSIMPSELTAGFDFSVQLSKSFIEKVLRTAFKAGKIPGYVQRHLIINQQEAIAEMYLQPPQLFFINDPRFENAVKLIFPFLLRLSVLDEELDGHIALVVPIALHNEIANQEEALCTFIIDLKKLEGDDVVISFAKVNPQTKVIAKIIEGMMTVYFAKNIVSLPFSPTISGNDLFIGGKIFTNPLFTPPLYEIYPEPDFLAIFINKDGIAKPLPQSFTPQLYHIPNFGNQTQKVAEIATAIPADFFMATFEKEIKKTGLNFPAELPGDKSIIIDDLTFELRKGHIFVEGLARKIILSISSPKVSFSAKLLFGIWDKKLVVSLNNVTVDLPAWAGALNFLVPFLGSLILGIFQRKIEALSAKSASVSLPEFTFFLDSLKVTSVGTIEENSIVIRNEGNILIDTTGFIVSSYIDLNFAAVPSKVPGYIRANSKSKEFHRAGCIYGDKIGKLNLKTFIREDVALKNGFNGCAYCYPEYDKVVSGNLEVFYSLLGQAAGKKIAKTVVYEISLVQAKGQKGKKENQSITVEADSLVSKEGLYKQSHFFADLMPGIWNVKLESDNWTTQGLKTVYSDRNARCRFTFGKPEIIKK